MFFAQEEVNFDELARKQSGKHAKGNRAQLVCLKHLPTNNYLIVVNAQLYYNQDQDYLKFAQTYYLLRKLSKFHKIMA
jgi:hypothetical protein